MRTPVQTFDNLAILASAGTGKTFQLTHRIIRLLALGVPPDRICAMTFSRKAAAEIYTELIAHLCRASRHPKGASQTAQTAELNVFEPADALRLLGILLREPQKVRIGTLDRFFVSVLRTFSPELGVPPDFVLTEAGSPEIQRLSLEILSELNRTQADPLIQLFRQASFGRDEPSFFRFLENELDRGRALFHRFPDVAAWGNIQRIWPKTPLWLRIGHCDYRKEAERALGEIETLSLPEPVRKNLADLVSLLVRVRPFQPIAFQARSKLISEILSHWEDLHKGLEFPYRRNLVRLSPALGQSLQKLLSRPFLYEMLRVRKQTRGLGRLLGWFEERYAETVRRGGVLTFDDVQRLLSPRHSSSFCLSRSTKNPDRLFLDYRLDASLDHWLLDEFQDTSDLQWSVLENLADEIIQDDSGTRSFFIVGDVKQAIYGWRQGNARLMGDILARYGQNHPRAFRQKILSESFRSSQPVLDAINAVFNRLPEETRLPAEVRAFWKPYWKPHQSHDPTCSGCTAWLEWAGPATDSSETGTDEEEEEGASEGIHRAMSAVIRELSPVGRNLSVAVLLRTNAECRQTAEALRTLLKKEGVPVANEGASEIADNPAVALFRSLIRHAAHPGDTLALGHLQMSPLRAHFVPPRPISPLELLETIQSRGFARFLREWEERLAAATPGGLSAYDAESLEVLKTLALQFDQTGLDDPDLFLEAVESRQRRELDDRPGVVRVMTIHQSKGLGFDAVLFPFPQSARGLDSTIHGSAFFLCGGSSEREWVLKSPGEPWRRMDPVLRASLEEAKNQTLFENLCLLYVALTRARRGLYLFSDLGLAAPEKQRPDKEPAFTALRLTALGLLGHLYPEEIQGEQISAGHPPLRRIYLRGDWTWYQTVPLSMPEKAETQTPPLSATFEPPTGHKRFRLLEPSEEETRIWSLRWLLSPEADAVRRFGDAIHALLARLSWLEETDPEQIAAEWNPDPSLDEAIRRYALVQFRRLFEKPEIRMAFHRPSEPIWLWREKPFEWAENKEWISGIFDRVVVRLDSIGKPSEAEILDYKSARVETPAEAIRAAEPYRPQMQLYRRALAGLLGLPHSRISVRLLFTRPGIFVPVF